MENRKALNCYRWLWLSPLVTVPTMVGLYNLFVAGSYPISMAIFKLFYCPPFTTNAILQRLAVYYTPVLGIIDRVVSSCLPYGEPCLTAALSAILGSALWHLVLLKPAFDKESQFVRWHGRQALLLTGLRVFVLLLLFTLFGLDSGTVFVPLLMVLLFYLWWVEPSWGRRQVERGDCSLMRWTKKLKRLPASGPGPGTDQKVEQEPNASVEPQRIVKSRRWLGLLPWLPVVALLGWFYYEQALAWTAPAPQWFIPKGGLATSGSCANLDGMMGNRFDRVPANEMPETRVTAGQAKEIADRVIARYTGYHIWLMWMGGSPSLGWTTLPDGQRRLVWADFDVVATTTGAYAGTGGEVVGIYIDASSGAPLALFTEIVIGDVMNGCSGVGMGIPWLTHLSADQFICVSLLGAYLIVWVLLSYLSGLWHYTRSTTTRRNGQTAG